MAGIYSTPKIYKSDAVGGIYNNGTEELSYVIGGRRYKCVKIDGKIWMAENLDYKFEGCSIGSANWSKSLPSAAYYRDDESTYGIDGARKCGLLYNGHAAQYLEGNKEMLIPGWHVPTDEEWTALTNAVGENPGTKLKALSNSVDSGTWPTNWGGTDDYGFGALPGGYYYNGFTNINTRGNFWTSSAVSSSSSNVWYRRIGTSTSVTRDNSGKTSGFSVRLVKD